MRASIQHKDSQNQKLILQALVPFTELRDSVLFTYRSQDTQGSYEKQTQFQASMDFYQRRVDSKRSNDIKDFIKHSILLEKKGSQNDCSNLCFSENIVYDLNSNSCTGDCSNITKYKFKPFSAKA